MKTITNNYKENVKLFGREIDSKITYSIDGETTELGAEELNSVTPHYEASILKSVMKQLDIDSNVEIPKGTILNYQFGVKVGDTFEYINYGNYVVQEVEKQEDLMSWKITCYDKMLYSMVDYQPLDIEYPITIREYIGKICNYLSLGFKNGNDEFVNFDKEIDRELYIDNTGASLGYTFRDVLDELAQVTASTICINENEDTLEIRYINDTEDTINAEYLKDINVNFGEKYGPVNSIVLSRAAESDNIYLRDEESIAENGLCELKIKENQIMNFDNRDEFLPGILGELDGLEYYLNDFSSTGITYYEVCDRYNIEIDDVTYSCIMFNDEVLVTQGLEENIHTDMPEENETDYKKADKTDRRINKTTLIVDKQQGEIRSLITQQNETSERVSQVIQDINSIQNLFQITGGNNLIKDSQKLLDDEGLWEYGAASRYSLFPGSNVYPMSSVYPIEYFFGEPVYVGGYDATLIGKTVSIAKLGVSNGKMSTSATNITGLIIDTMYTLSFKITNEENTSARIKLIGNGNVVYQEIFTTPRQMEEIVFSFVANTSNYVLEIQSTSTTSGFTYIYDLMLNKGDVQTWEPSAGEIVSTTLKLSQLGFQVYSTGSDIATLMTAQGFDIRRFQNGTLYEIVTTFNKEGFQSKKGILDELQVGNFEYKTVNYQGYETLVLYKKESDS